MTSMTDRFFGLLHAAFILLIVALPRGAAIGAEPAPETQSGAIPSSQPAASSSTPPATNPSTVPASPQVDDLIRRLSDQDWKIRDRAADGLVRLGEAARPALKQLLAGQPDPAAAQEALNVLNRIDEQSRYGATLVSLHLHEVTPKDAFDTVATRAGVTFTPQLDTLWPDEGAERVNIDVDDQPLWSVLLQLCPQAHVRVQEARSQASIGLVRVSPKDPPAHCYATGPFLVMIKKIVQTREIEFAGPPSRQGFGIGCFIQCFVLAEPKMGPLTWRTHSTEAIETDGGPLRDPKFIAGGYMGGMTGSNEGTVSFRTPLPGKSLKRLRMIWQFTIEGKNETFQVDNVLKAGRTERVIDGYRIALTEVNKVTDGRFAFSLEVTPGIHSNDEFTAFRGALSTHFPRMLDAKGQPLMQAGGSASMGPDFYRINQTVMQNVGNRQLGEPTKFLWEIPSETRTFLQPVEFTDLPLP